MPFFEGAYNFTTNHAVMNDVPGNLTQNTTNVAGNPNQNTTNISEGSHLNMSYLPYHFPDPWAISIQQNISARRDPNRITNFDEIKDPDVPEWPFFNPLQYQHPMSSPPAPFDKPDRDAEIGFRVGRAASDVSSRKYLWWVLTDLLPRQIYLHLLLRLPSLYSTRIGQILNDADLSLVEMKDMALRSLAADDKTIQYIAAIRKGTEPREILPPTYQQTKERWESFIDSLLEEWRTLTIVSALLVPGILTMFQIEGAAPDDHVARHLALWSLLSALVSLLYGCMFIIQFSRMRKVYKMVEWAVESKYQGILWNVPVMLAMPVIWLTWSIVAFIISIVWFMWRASVRLPDNPVSFSSDKTDLGFRIFICAALGVGVLYGLLIFVTFQKYGKNMDRTWKIRVADLLQVQLANLLSATMRAQPETQGPQTMSRPPHSKSFRSPVPAATPSPQTPHTPGGAFAPQRLNPQGWPVPVVSSQAQAQAQPTSSHQLHSPISKPI